MEATIFTGWTYEHLLPYAEKVKVADPLGFEFEYGGHIIVARSKGRQVTDRGRGNYLSIGEKPP
jgi:hypothetical protein